MNELRLARKAATLLVVGHICIFIFGFVVAGLGKFLLKDVVQMILMGTPLLTLVAIAGFAFVVNNGLLKEENFGDVDRSSVNLIFFIIYAFLFSLTFIYSLALFDVSTISVDEVKFAVGAIETIMGGYIGIIKDKLFPVEVTPN